MSKKSKKANSDFRRSEKSKRRAANQAKYSAMAGTAANKKKKGASGRSSGVKWCRCHEIDCGNIGCKRCYPDLDRAY